MLNTDKRRVEIPYGCRPVVESGNITRALELVLVAERHKHNLRQSAQRHNFPLYPEASGLEIRLAAAETFAEAAFDYLSAELEIATSHAVLYELQMLGLCPPECLDSAPRETEGGGE